MKRRIANVVLFVGAAIGTILFGFGMVEVSRGNRAGWLYLLAALLVVALGFTPGRRLRDIVRPPDVQPPHP